MALSVIVYVYAKGSTNGVWGSHLISLHTPTWVHLPWVVLLTYLKTSGKHTHTHYWHTFSKNFITILIELFISIQARQFVCHSSFSYRAQLYFNWLFSCDHALQPFQNSYLNINFISFNSHLNSNVSLCTVISTSGRLTNSLTIIKNVFIN